MSGRKGQEARMNIIHKWRGVDTKEAVIWAHLRIDRIEKAINLPYLQPDLKDITNKLQEEATDKEEYAPQGSVSFFPEFFTKGWIKIPVCFRHLINGILCSKQCKGQNQTANKGKDKTNDI
jgi:hypothetical protein